jgi:hypothetical protein
MKRIHVTLIALLLAIAAVLGTVAATRTVNLGAAGRKANDAAYLARVKQLNAYAASLQRQLAARTTPTSGASAAAPAPRIVYHRPPPIVVVKHTHHGDDGGFENAAEGGGGDG